MILDSSTSECIQFGYGVGGRKKSMKRMLSLARTLNGRVLIPEDFY
jgi:hypothetical protein